MQDSIDMTQGEISERLYALYDYMKQRVMDASINMDKQPLDEVANLMITIKLAWDKIPDEEKTESLRDARATARPIVMIFFSDLLQQLKSDSIALHDAISAKRRVHISAIH